MVNYMGKYFNVDLTGIDWKIINNLHAKFNLLFFIWKKLRRLDFGTSSLTGSYPLERSTEESIEPGSGSKISNTLTSDFWFRDRMDIFRLSILFLLAAENGKQSSNEWNESSYEIEDDIPHQQPNHSSSYFIIKWLSFCIFEIKQQHQATFWEERDIVNYHHHLK